MALGLLSELFVACSSDSKPFGEIIAESNKISINSSERHLSFDIERRANVHVNASKNMGWYATTNGNDWISLNNNNLYYDGYGSATLIVSVNEDNPSEQKRTATINIYSQRFNSQESITVEQAGGYISAPNSLTFTAMSMEHTLTVNSNVSWELSLPYSSFLQSASPQTGSPGKTTITLISKSNTKAQEDEEKITIRPNNSKSTVSPQIIQIKREKVTLDVTQNKTSLEKSGGTFTVDITSNSEWRITNLNSWLKPNVNSGTGNKLVTFTVGTNSGTARNCTFTILAGEVQKQLSIRQKGMPTPDENDNTTPRYIKKL